MGVLRKHFLGFKPLAFAGLNLGHLCFLPTGCRERLGTDGRVFRVCASLSSGPAPVADAQVCSGPRSKVPMVRGWCMLGLTHPSLRDEGAW